MLANESPKSSSISFLLISFSSSHTQFYSIRAPRESRRFLRRTLTTMRLVRPAPESHQSRSTPCVGHAAGESWVSLAAPNPAPLCSTAMHGACRTQPCRHPSQLAACLWGGGIPAPLCCHLPLNRQGGDPRKAA